MFLIFFCLYCLLTFYKQLRKTNKLENRLLSILLYFQYLFTNNWLDTNFFFVWFLVKYLVDIFLQPSHVFSALFKLSLGIENWSELSVPNWASRLLKVYLLITKNIILCTKIQVFTFCILFSRLITHLRKVLLVMVMT